MTNENIGWFVINQPTAATLLQNDIRTRTGNRKTTADPNVCDSDNSHSSHPAWSWSPACCGRWGAHILHLLPQAPHLTWTKRTWSPDHNSSANSLFNSEGRKHSQASVLSLGAFRPKDLLNGNSQGFSTDNTIHRETQWALSDLQNRCPISQRHLTGSCQKSKV